MTIYRPSPHFIPFFFTYSSLYTFIYLHLSPFFALTFIHIFVPQIKNELAKNKHNIKIKKKSQSSEDSAIAAVHYRLTTPSRHRGVRSPKSTRHRVLRDEAHAKNKNKKNRSRASRYSTPPPSSSQIIHPLQRSSRPHLALGCRADGRYKRRARFSSRGTLIN